MSTINVNLIYSSIHSTLFEKDLRTLNTHANHTLMDLLCPDAPRACAAGLSVGHRD